MSSITYSNEYWLCLFHSKPSPDTMNEYNKKVDFLKGLIETQKMVRFLFKLQNNEITSTPLRLVGLSYSGTSIKRPLSKVPIYLSVNCCIWYFYSTATSFKQPRPPFCCRKCIIYMVFNLHWVASRLSFQAFFGLF